MSWHRCVAFGRSGEYAAALTKGAHAQVYEFGCHRAKLALLRDGALDDRRAGDTRFAGLADFLESEPHRCPHNLFRREDASRASSLVQNFRSLKRLVVIEKQNTATDMAALIIPVCGSNFDRHPNLQRFMLANDTTTVAVEVTIWLGEDDIAALERKYRVTIVPKQPIDPANPATGHRPRTITGHIDFLQVRNGAIHILDYKPDAGPISRSPSSRSAPSPSRASSPASASSISNVRSSAKTSTTNPLPRPLLPRESRSAVHGPVSSSIEATIVRELAKLS